MSKPVPATEQAALYRQNFLINTASKKLLVLNCIFAALYFAIITFGFKHGNPILFYLLILGEVFHLYQIVGYCFTVRGSKKRRKFDDSFSEPVDIFITVAGEPVNIVRETAIAARDMDYPNHKVYLLNDGFVAKKDNWKDIESLAKELGIGCVTRTVPGGAKAGNINSGLRHTKSDYFVVFDADHVPHRDFLRKTMGFFVDERMGFVQTPQFYHNQAVNGVTQTAWDQQTLFFGPIMTGKNRHNAAFMCGTNMAIRRTAIMEAGGMCEFNIAEDFLTSLFIHDKGWKSVYVPEILAEGLAPEDFLSYYKQQFRWTRGSLEVIFKYNPLFKRGLSFSQKMEYLVSASYYLSGVVVIIDALLPLIFLYTGITAVVTSTMALALVFIPYMFFNLYALQRTSNFSYSFNAISYSLSSCFLQVRAIIAVLTNQKTSFAVTSKEQIEGNFPKLVLPHILFILAFVIGTIVGFAREGLSASLMANFAWGFVNVLVFIPFIKAAIPKPRNLFFKPKPSNNLNEQKA